MDKSKIKKVVLAYSGGLDTSIIIPWLKENYNNCEVIAVSGNVGQADELEGLEEKAKKTGASKLYVEDLTEEFVNEYILPTVKAGAKYEGYMLGTSFARPIIAKRIVAARARATIRFALSLRSRLSRRTCRSLRLGANGKSNPATRRSIMPRRIMCR